MIKNENQYNVTKTRLEEFERALNSLKKANEEDELLTKIMADSLKSQIETFNKELKEYEFLIEKKPSIIISSINHLPEALIKVRLIKGISHSSLARMTGLKKQQIQRYESTNYEGANFGRLMHIANAMEAVMEDTKVVVKQEVISVEGFDQSFLLEATRKLRDSKTLLPA